jgi:hypothetical protein
VNVLSTSTSPTLRETIARFVSLPAMRPPPRRRRAVRDGDATARARDVSEGDGAHDPAPRAGSGDAYALADARTLSRITPPSITAA